MPFPILPSNSASGYNLTKSLRFRNSANAYLNRSAYPTSSGTKYTFSFWIKFGTLASVGVPDLLCFVDTGNSRQAGIGFTNAGTGALSWWEYAGSYTLQKNTAQLFRDPSAWYHIICVWDSANATADDRAIIYVNGVRVTAFSTNTNPAQNTVTQFSNGTLYPYLGAQNRNNSSALASFDGEMAEINFIDGQSLPASSFGSFNTLTGVWQPAKYTGTYGTNGFYLPFTNTTSTSTLGNDFSGNGNNWTTNNFSLTAGTTYDSLTDVPTLTNSTTANYAVWNPLVLFPNTTYQATMTNANMLMTRSGGGQGGAVTTIGVTSGKFYAEMPVTAVGGSVTKLGVMATNDPPSISAGSEYALGDTSASVAYRSNGARLTGGTTTNSWGSTYTTGDVIGVAFDADTGKVWFAKNGTWQASGDPAAGTNQAATLPTGVPFYFSAGGESGISISLNCGQQPLSYTPPTGFVALNTFNLPTSTIVKGNTVMDATLYTGNGSTQTIVNSGAMKPDLAWIKSRSSSFFGALVDSVRGVDKYWYSALTIAEETQTTALSSFNSNGFSLAGAFGNVNANGTTYVGWQWQAGQGTTSSNTSGSITSTVSVNASAGFSVVTYTGTGSNATVGHGLGVAPKWIIVKNRTQASANIVGHSDMATSSPWNGFLQLQSISAYTTSGGNLIWNDTAPTSSVFSIGTDTSTNFNGNNFVAYCWAEVAGYSKFGSFIGNNSLDGPFVYLGFRPAFFMVKRTDVSSDWFMLDDQRPTFNVIGAGNGGQLAANQNYAESVLSTYAIADFLSNGIKVRADMNYGYWNASGGTYIYMAFAENPFKNALAR
jgi:hypothetical protein